MATKTQPATDFFATSVKVRETKKTPDKQMFLTPELDDKIKRYLELKAQIEAATGNLKMIEGDIKGKGTEIFLRQYKLQRSTPDNFKMQDGTGASCLFIIQDKYTIVDENKAELLSSFEDLVEEKVEWKFNSDLVAKYSKVLSKLIGECKEIEADDKPLLISGEKTFSIRKGSIDRLMLYENPEQIFDLISPIKMLKK